MSAGNGAVVQARSMLGLAANVGSPQISGKNHQASGSPHNSLQQQASRSGIKITKQSHSSSFKSDSRPDGDLHHTDWVSSDLTSESGIRICQKNGPYGKHFNKRCVSDLF